MNKVFSLLVLSFLCANIAFAEDIVQDTNPVEELETEIVNFNRAILFEQILNPIDYYAKLIDLIGRFEDISKADLSINKSAFERALTDTQALITLKQEMQSRNGESPTVEQLMKEFYRSKAAY